MNSLFFQYMILFIKAAYIICSIVLFLYGVNCLILTTIYLINKKKIWANHELHELKNWPTVTIQLPIYNEGRLVNGLLHSVVGMDYPKRKLQIQILDDSNDSTSAELVRLVDQYQKMGYWIVYQHRSDRAGFKAGNLSSGLKNAKGEFIVIFDADFEPKTDFLSQTIPLFKNKKVGFIQTRWANRNFHHNMVTYMAGLAYDAHLLIEQNARYCGGLFMGFSGSGGIWRKICLTEIGGWQSDTVTEDIDITFRAQLNGWRGIYVPSVLSNAELPEEMDAYKLQQNRWAKGSAQCFRKYIGKVIFSKLPLNVKIMAVLHLLSYVTIPFMPLLLILVLPICLFGGGFITLFWWTALGGIGPAISFILAQLLQNEHLGNRLLHLPLVLLMAAGISLDAFAGVMAGLFQQGGDFIRTSRVFEDGKNAEKERKADFLTNLTIAEVLMGCYLVGPVVILWNSIGKYLAPWLLSSGAGFFLMSGASMFQNLGLQRKKILKQEN